MTKEHDQQLIRVIDAGIVMTETQQAQYIKSADILSAEAQGGGVSPGYKRCGSCKEIKKFYLFNQNRSSKTNCTGNCKECQKQAAQKSYAKTKKSRNYKKYYAENREMKREHNKRYYANNKERLTEKHKAYRQTPAGKKAMSQAHATRQKSLKANAGIPYTRALVIDRDSVFIAQEHPICCLCFKPITDPTDLHMEHIIPVVIGGANCFTNVGCAHSTCNLSKSKDAHEITVEQVQTIADRAEVYIAAHPEHFPDFHGEAK